MYPEMLFFMKTFFLLMTPLQIQLVHLFHLLQSPHFINILDDFDRNGTQDTLTSSNGPNAACDLSPNPTASMPSPSVSPAPLIVNQPLVVPQTEPRRST